MRRLAAVFLVGVLVTGPPTACGRPGHAGQLDTAESYGVGDPVWAGDGWIYYADLPTDDSDGGWGLSRTRPGSRPQSLEFDDDCVGDGLRVLFPMPDSTLGLVLDCQDGDYFELAVWDVRKAAISSRRRLDCGGIGGVAWRASDGLPIGSAEKCGGGLAILDGSAERCLTRGVAIDTAASTGPLSLWWMSRALRHGPSCAAYRSCDVVVVRLAGGWRTAGHSGQWICGPGGHRCAVLGPGRASGRSLAGAGWTVAGRPTHRRGDPCRTRLTPEPGRVAGSA
jgi:hypothetical protein